jgi:hypothetical protein
MQDTHLSSPSASNDWSWAFWPLLPLYPYGKRRTLRTEVVKDSLWIFEQVQGILYVVVPIRMTVIKLESGGLLVYAPVAPTPECLRLMQELVAEHGAVKYIILPTISGLEHKVFVGPFARQFPQAQVYVAPGQWSFPVNLPLSWLGFPMGRTRILPEDSFQTPFGNEFDYAILGAIDLGPGRFSEVAFFHRRSHTLLLTDTIVSVPEYPPAIVQLDPYPLLFHAKDEVTDEAIDDATNRHKGWQRIALFALYFRPSALQTTKLLQSFRDALKARDRSAKALFGWYPFQWQFDWQHSFHTLRHGGRLFVAPVLQTLILNRAPKETLAWADQVAGWEFHRIIPCHFDAPLDAGSDQFRQAFTFLEKGKATDLSEADFALLRDLDKTFSRAGIVPPRKEKI